MYTIRYAWGLYGVKEGGLCMIYVLKAGKEIDINLDIFFEVVAFVT